MAVISYDDKHQTLSKTPTLLSSPQPVFLSMYSVVTKGERSNIISPRTLGSPRLLRRFCRWDSHPENKTNKKKQKKKLIFCLQVPSTRWQHWKEKTKPLPPHRRERKAPNVLIYLHVSTVFIQIYQQRRHTKYLEHN